MAHVKHGHLTASPEWWKHLRPFVKRLFWKRHRKAEQREAEAQKRERDDERRVPRYP